MSNLHNPHCSRVKKSFNCKLTWRFVSYLFVLASLSLSGCASTGRLSASTHIRLQQSQPIALTSRSLDARPISEKIYRIGVKPGYAESVALGDENFIPDRLQVLDNRLQSAVGNKLKDADEVLVERFEVIEYVKDIKTPTTGEILGGYSKIGIIPPPIAIPIAIPIRQIIDRVITTETEVELRIKINGNLFVSKMISTLPDVDRERGVSEAFELAFKYLVYDLEAALQQ